MVFITGFKIRIPRWIDREPRQSQKEGQEDQGTLKHLGGPSLAFLHLPGPPGLPLGFPWLSLVSLEGTIAIQEPL